MTEIWREIKGYKGLYQVSNLGNVRSMKYNKTNKIKNLRTSKDMGGYLHLSLQKGSKVKTESVHRLVANAFIENPDRKPESNHKNGIKTDNRSINLEWCTSSENTKHAIRNGFHISLKGDRVHFAKLNEKQVRVIKHLKNINSTLSNRWIAGLFGVSERTILRIITCTNWKHIII